MYNLNTWHAVLRDTTVPTLTLKGGLKPKLFFGTEIFIYNLDAFDDGKDISSSIKVETDGMLKSHIEGATNLTFTVSDSGGNKASLTTEVDVLGTWVQATPVVYDFIYNPSLPDSLTPENDTTFEFNENGLQFTGTRPPSPYWNLIHQMNANGAVQFALKGEGAGITFRWQDVDNHGWTVLQGGTVEIRERVAGDWLSRGAFAIADYSPETEYLVGLEVVDDLAEVYLDGQPLGSAKVYDNLYATGWGVWSNSSSVTFSKVMFAKPNDITFGNFEVDNIMPTANAGTMQTVSAGATVQLDGTGSTDGDGTIVSYAWAQTAGDAVILTGASTATPSFTAPSTNAQQTLTFELTVTDNVAQPDTDTVDITVEAATQIIRPFINNASRNFNFKDKDGLWTDNLRVTEIDSYTMTIDPAWISPEAIINYSVTPQAGLTVVADARQDNVIQVFLQSQVVGRASVRFDFETATRSDHVVVNLDVVS